MDVIPAQEENPELSDIVPVHKVAYGTLLLFQSSYYVKVDKRKMLTSEGNPPTLCEMDEDIIEYRKPLGVYAGRKVCLLFNVKCGTFRVVKPTTMVKILVGSVTHRNVRSAMEIRGKRLLKQKYLEESC